MDKETLLAAMEFTRVRVIGTLDTIAKSGQNPSKVLAWRPGSGRAHIAWQAMHCAATHDKYLNVFIKGGQPRNPQLVEAFGGGSTPSDHQVPTLAQIRDALAGSFEAFKEYLRTADLAKVVGPPDRRRTIAEAAMLMAWHEAHHQGQIHLTWNLYRQANGMA